MTVSGGKSSMRNLVIFTVAALGCGWAGRWIDTVTEPASPEESLGMLVWLVTPIAVSLVLRAFAGDGWKDLGIKPRLCGHSGAYTISLTVYPVCIALVLLVGWLTGVTAFTNVPVTEVAGVFGGLVATTLVKNVLEEFAWRGYFVPKVDGTGINRFVGHVLVGIIWGLWHVPYLSFVFGYLSEGAGTLPPPRLLIGTTAASIVYGEIRLRTGSVWPAVLMHTVGGAVIGALFMADAIRIDSGMLAVLSPGIEGVLMTAVFTLVGVVMFFRGNRIQEHSVTNNR